MWIKQNFTLSLLTCYSLLQVLICTLQGSSKHCLQKSTGFQTPSSLTEMLKIPLCWSEQPMMEQKTTLCNYRQQAFAFPLTAFKCKRRICMWVLKEHLVGATPITQIHFSLFDCTGIWTLPVRGSIPGTNSSAKYCPNQLREKFFCAKQKKINPQVIIANLYKGEKEDW